MKVCKKCKTKVSNKTKVCKKCGSDVSKCKIIKTDTNKKQKANKKQINKEETIIKNIIPKEEIKEIKQEEIKQEEINKKEKIILIIKKIISSTKKELLIILKKTKTTSSKYIKLLLKRVKILIINLYKVLSKYIVIITKIILKVLRRIILTILNNTKNILISIRSFILYIKNKIELLIKIIINLSLIIIKYLESIIINITNVIIKTLITLKETIFHLLKQLLMPILNRINPKPVLIATIIICLFGGTSCIFAAQYQRYSQKELEERNKTAQKATNEKIFSMGDTINYKGVNYKVTGVETSEGDSYKEPKEGNIFLIVYLTIENNTLDKINYSYNNWTMSNSTDNEEKMIFSYLNSGTQLYTGELEIGNTKKASLIFETPKDENRIRLNYYELTTDENGLEEIDVSKKVFSISIKIPEKVEIDPIENDELISDDNKISN